MKVFEYVFMAAYMVGALWLIISGISSFFIKRSVFWIGDKVFDWSGRKAILGGVLLVLVGSGLLAYAAWFVWEQAFVRR